ncbi:hypothetical protein H0H93_016577 [Arthromyces matolae]|nr:hypothetical protein H0H93_016577 [Arthromyces matolae]
MKITVNSIILILSLSALSTTATPIKFNSAVGQDLFNSPHNVETPGTKISGPMQKLVKRGFLFPKGPDPTSTLVDSIAKAFPETINPNNVASLRQRLTSLSENLEGRFEARNLQNQVAKSAETALTSWRAKVESALEGNDNVEYKHLRATIATCRNIVQEILNPSWTHFSDAIDNVLKNLEKTLPGDPSLHAMTEAVTQLEKLDTSLRTAGFSDMSAKIINDKLVTFSDWVEGWTASEELRQQKKTAVQMAIEGCKKKMPEVLIESVE